MNILKCMVCGVFILMALGIMPAFAKKAPKEVLTNESAKAAASAESNQPPVAAAPKGDAILAPDTVLVKIDGQAVTQADLDKEIAQIRQMMEGRGGSPQQFEAMLKSIKPQILEGLIVRKLIAAECDREKITVTPEETAKEIEIFQASLPKKISLDDFLKQNKITRDVFERDVNEQIKIEKLLKISAPTDDEIKAYYDENKATQFEVPETVTARHILIAFDAADDAAKKDAKKKKAEDLRKKLNEGADFAKLAQENSDCPSKARGGNLGEFPRGNMVPAFEQAAFSLKTNEISNVVETEFGYHIIQTTAHNPPRTKPLDEVKGQIAFRLKSKKVQEKLSALVKKLKDTAKIEYTKEGESLKPAPMPESAFPMMPVNEKDVKGAGKESKEKPADEKSDKPAK